MGDFDLIETGFNNADETINFGTRSIGCETTSLFEICTLACFKSEDQSFAGTNDVILNTFIRNRYFFFATNKSLKIFQDTQMSHFIFTSCFESNITYISLSFDEQYFIICFETGLVCLYSINEEDVRKVYSEYINNNISCQSVHMLDDFVDHRIDAAFLIVFTDGFIARITVSKNNENQCNVNTERMFNLHCKITSSDFSYPLLTTNGSVTNIINIETEEVISHEAVNIKSFFALGATLLCLDFDGNILKMCTLTFKYWFVDYDFLLNDLYVVKDDKFQILAVTKPNEIGEIFLQLIEASDFTQIFSLKIQYPVHLVQMDFTKNDVVFVSKISSDNKITELRLQSVFETDPESRLTRLIKRRRFEEAEKFAHTFNIDPSIILKAKAQLIVDETKCTSEDIETLINLMDHINDAQFNLQCCSNVDCSNVDDVRKILTYGSKISPKIGDDRRDDILNMKGTMLDLLLKFETFMVLSTSGDIQSWTNFSLCNLLLEVKEYLKNYRIQDAIIVYSRLDQTAINSINAKHIKDILEIFNKLPADLYQPFLPTFFPITMTHFPSALHLFVNWLLDKIYLMEKRDSANFPQNSIDMVEDIIKLIRVEKSSYISFQRHCMSNRGFDDLTVIIEGLNVLQTLKKKFGITVQLCEYLEGPKVLTGTLIKLSMRPEQYDFLLKHFLYPYMLQNNIDPDQIFIEEINNLLKFNESWITIIEVILQHFSSVELKLITIRDILEKSPVPWCNVTRRIAQKSLELSHPLVNGIRETFNEEPRLIVLRNSKYGIKKANLQEEFGRFVHRIIYVNESQMIDDVYQLCQSDSERLEASVILLQHLISRGRLDEAMLVFGNKLQKEAYDCAYILAHFAELNINNKKTNKKIQENCYNFSPTLYKKLIELSKTDSDKKQFEKDFRILRGVYYFNNKLESSFTTCNFKSSLTHKQTYEELLMTIVDFINLGALTFREILQYSEKVAYYLSKKTDEVLVTLCDKLKNFEIIYKAGEYLFDIESESKYLCLIASLFIKYLGYQSSTAFDLSSVDNVYDQTLPTFDKLKYEEDSCINDNYINLAEKLMTKAYMKAHPDDILKIHEVNNWISSCYHLTKQASTLQDELYKNLFCPKENLPSTTVLCTIRNCFEAYNFTLDRKKWWTNSEYLTFFSSDGSEIRMEPLAHEVSSLSSTIDTLCQEGQHLTALYLLRTLSISLYLQPSVDKTLMKPLRLAIHTRFFPQIMYVVVSAKQIDMELLYNLLLSVRQDAMKYLRHYRKLYKRNSKKFQDLSIVGIRLTNHYKESTGVDVMENSVKTCKWWRKLASVTSKIMYDEFFKCDADARLKQLINSEFVGIDEIIIYCKDFNLTVDQYFKEYLRSSLINWKPEYHVESIHGIKKVIVKNDEDALCLKCQAIINVIEDKERAGVFASMEKMLKEVNFYHYEVFLAIYKILENNQSVSNSKYIDMLLFLKNYTRFKTPSQREKEEWYITFPDTQLLDPLSEYRLPFTLILFTSDIWSILRPEISLKSYEIWFSATAVLRKNLKVDDICVYAVKQTVSSGILENKSATGWILYSQLNDLFAEVDKCVQHISDLERATSAVYHIMNHTPDGADKVKAAELSFKYASKYRNKHLEDTEVERAYVKVKNKFYGLSVCHILHRFNLAKDNYFKLVTQPHSLIESLYMDERIPKYAGTFSLEYSDINNAVDALAHLFNLDIEQIRLQLLNRWLNSSYMEVDMDTSYFLPTVPIASKISASDSEDNLKRALYICSSGNQQHWQTYLLRVGLNDEEDENQKNLAFKSKALKCFCAITSESTIVELTKLSYNEFLNYIDKLTLLGELESLGIFLNVENLDQYKKKELLKKLSTMGKPLAIKCMGAICITYFLKEDKYWEYIVTNSIKLEMIEELKIYIEFLKDKCDKYYYVNAWQALIDKSFQQISNISDEEDLEATLVNNILLIQSCPVSFSINFEKIIEYCIKLNKSEYAALLLQYIPEKKRNSIEKDILDSKSIECNLEKLEKKGLWGVRSIKRFILSNSL